MVASPSLEVLKNQADVTLRAVVSGYGRNESMVERGDFSGLSQP